MGENTSTILLVHSAPVVCSVLTDMLEQAGYLVRVAGDLGTAADMLNECTPDLLVTELYIAEVSGHDAAQYLSKKCPSMSVLIVGAFLKINAPKSERQARVMKFSRSPSDRTNWWRK